jgi:hypothetical protein
MIGLRFKTNDLNTINPNMLLFHQYGLVKNVSNRFLDNFFSNPSVVSVYEFYENTYTTNLIFKNINKYFIPNIIYDINLYHAEYFSRNNTPGVEYERWDMLFIELCATIHNCVRNEVEREILGFFYSIDMNKPFSYLLT